MKKRLLLALTKQKKARMTLRSKKRLRLKQKKLSVKCGIGRE